ncbi:ABC transporter ATP-binding protein [Bifidobacterium sp. ESL0682]|uniref:ABC transporter ATP-binding protein n=1 Tax=Bifidobacterium sp. ESL0682 TaxID=2983212 RepID=UPI0023F79716|nr:ABC transporter ATP-binding protein [Bifidobacterium sp. ESL0682]WEV41907.1 ABC transporter ATP-binding protein [Bifidobacterium sp. ESL0682]
MGVLTSHDANHQHPAHTLKARHVALSYEGRQVVADLSLDIPAHQVGVIIGPNGCCKSTLLKALARLIKPDKGSIMLDGQSLSDVPTREVATKVGLLPQSPLAPEGITIADLVTRGRYPYHGLTGGWNDDDEEAVAHALAVTGLAELADRPIESVSGGQRQRAWIALALAQETDILLLDEPTTYLDIAYQVEVLDLLSYLNAEEGVTVVMVLHDLNLAARYADWMVAMKDGTIRAQGTAQEVLTEPLLRNVFGLNASVATDPSTGLPMVVPDKSHSLAAQRDLRLFQPAEAVDEC